MTNTYIDIDDEAVNAVLGRLVDLGADTRAVTRPISEDLMAAVEDKFERELAPDGPWPDLAASTQKAREAHGTWPGKKLQVSGRLVAAMQPFYDADEAGVANNVVYAAIHNFGGAIAIPARSQHVYFHEKDGEVGTRFVKKAHSNFAQWATLPQYGITIPAREYFWLSDDDWQRIFDTTESVLDQVIAGTG